MPKLQIAILAPNEPAGRFMRSYMKMASDNVADIHIITRPSQLRGREFQMLIYSDILHQSAYYTELSELAPTRLRVSHTSRARLPE